MAKNPSIPTPKTPLIRQEHGREKPLYSDNLKGKAPIFRQLERENPCIPTIWKEEPLQIDTNKRKMNKLSVWVSKPSLFSNKAYRKVEHFDENWTMSLKRKRKEITILEKSAIDWTVISQPGFSPAKAKALQTLSSQR